MKFHKVMRLAMKSYKLPTIALVVQQQAGRTPVFTTKVIYQWGSHGTVMQAVLFQCISSVANNFQMKHWLQLSLKYTSQQITVMKNKSSDYFNRLSSSQNKQSTAI